MNNNSAVPQTAWPVGTSTAFTLPTNDVGAPAALPDFKYITPAGCECGSHTLDPASKAHSTWCRLHTAEGPL